ncbi:choice-of-anchor J domain-containing protein [Streptomyces cirratus]|uniref:choice-of-anchor J domain-containing protein n=1 Tax=Streptomyces cirratus TaxID=68187 RepID=UPI00167DDA60|nr:choice-of-anchor J domain-containing protein [Streptomyces cirratus]
MTTLLAAFVLSLGVSPAHGHPATDDPLPKRTHQRADGPSHHPERHWRKSPHLHEQARTGHWGGDSGAGLPIGTRRTWPTIDWDFQVVLQEFELREVAPHIELWVRTGDMRVDTSDCSSSNADDLVVPDQQLRYIAEQFERVIRSREGRVFGFATPRDGSKAKPELLDPSIPADAWRGKGDRVVALVDNIPSGGQFLGDTIDAVDRNFLIVQAAGWKTMVGPKPKSLGPDLCRVWEGFPMPNYIEGLLAHEYNHVLWHSRAADVTAPAWITEGTAEWARWLVGYDDRTQDALKNLKIACFQGRQDAAMPPGYTDPYGDRNGGPENSLTVWPDPGQSVLCDYGGAETMIHTLDERYGHGFVKDLLFAGGGSGFDRLSKTLARHHAKESAFEILKDWSATAALDGLLDDGAKFTSPEDPARFRAKALHSTVNLDTPFAYARPGAPSNGADFVRLRDGADAYLKARDLRSVRFDSPAVYPTRPVEWSVDPDGHGPGDPALSSGPLGADVSFDRSIVRSVTVDPADPTLSFDARWDIEPGYDLAVVQVSTDGGATFTSRQSAGMVTALPNAVGNISSQVPGFNGDSGGWTHQTIDLSDLAGRTVLVAFRYLTDSSLTFPGLWIDNVKAGATLVSDGSTLTGWQTVSAYQIKKIPGISLRLAAFTADHKQVWTAEVPLDGDRHAALGPDQLRRLLGTRAETVFAIVDHYEPTETVLAPAPYRLTVNGVLQPGG